MPSQADQPAGGREGILPTHTPGLFRLALERAVAALRAGEMVAVPTETVYGLAADARDPVAVGKVFAAKGRPAHNPLIVHVASLADARRWVADWPAAAGELARAFWPGPLTLVLPRAGGLADAVTAGGATVGIRWPRHPFIQALIQECGFPLAAPSANRANQVSPTTAEHVRRGLGEAVCWIVDGGPCPVGLESTVVDLSGSPPRVLRPGMISAEALRAVLGPGVTAGAEAEEGPRRSPGQWPRHYAPRARLLVGRWADTGELHRWLASQQVRPGAAHVVAHTCLPSPAGLAGVSLIPHEPEAFARALYAELHRADEAQVGVIVVEAVPQEEAWAAIADRLRRASA